MLKKLIDDGKTVNEISKQLGMKPEEIFRLSDFSKEDFLALMTKGVKGYSKAEALAKYDIWAIQQTTLTRERRLQGIAA